MVFLPVTLVLYFLIPERLLKVRNLWLLIASLIFYGWGEPKYIAVMAFSIVFNYVMGRFVSRSKALLVFCLFGNLALLGFFKYTDFLIETLNDIFGSSIGLLNIALPIGISFYTFQTMSYIIDVYRGKVPPQRNFIAFAAYVTLFPQLIAGPIVRYSDVAAMLVGRKSNLGQIAEGVRRFIIGFGKKVLLANQIYVIWSEITRMPTSEISTATAWLGAACFTFQIYFDFSGYSDMAIGLGKIFGFDYLENFNYPYISRSITEFWRRWHMSLSSWFKEYVYIPLGGNRKGLPRQIFNIAVVWTLTGLWHGASWNFVAWGMYFGVILILEKLWFFKWLEKCPAFIGHLYSLVLIVLGWVIFALTDFSQMKEYLLMMFGGASLFIDSDFKYLAWSRIWVLIACAIASTPLVKLVCERIADRLVSIKNGDVWFGMLETTVLLGILALSIAFLVSGSYNPFLYFRF